MIDWLKHQIEHNEFFAGFVGAGLIGWLGWALRNIPHKIWLWTYSKAGTSLSINSSRREYVSVLKWFQERKFFDSRQRYHIYGKNSGEWWVEEEQLSPEKSIAPAAGVYYSFYKGRPCRLSLKIEKNQNGGWEESLKFYCFAMGGRKRRAFLKSIEELLFTERQTRRAFRINGRGGFSKTRLKDRDFSTLFLMPEAEGEIRSGLERFERSRGTCLRLGIAHNFCFLLHGCPGSGKTSVASAIATELGFSVYYLSLSELKSDTAFLDAWDDIKPRSVVVLDDIDAQKTDLKDRDKQDPGVSISALLSALDGPASLDESVVVMISNNPDCFDAALERKGRIDAKVEIGEIDRPVALALAARITGKDEGTCGEILGGGDRFVGCDVQDAALNYLFGIHRKGNN